MSACRRGRSARPDVIGRAILSRNAEAAESCTYGEANDTLLVAATAKIDIPQLPEDKQVCLQIKLKDWSSGYVRVTLPGRDTGRRYIRFLALDTL